MGVGGVGERTEGRREGRREEEARDRPAERLNADEVAQRRLLIARQHRRHDVDVDVRRHLVEVVVVVM